MSRSARLGLFSTSAFVVLVSLATLMYLPSEHAGAQPSGPPVIIVANIDLSAPATGSQVAITTYAHSFGSGSVDSSTTIFITNVSTGKTTATQNYHAVKDLTLRSMGFPS